MARTASELGGEVKLEKIHGLSEISEQERHYKVLLIPDNISVVRRNPVPYTLPVIPRPLPSTAGPSQSAVEGGSEMQAIVILGSLESVPTNQTEPTGVDRIESQNTDPFPSALQVIPLFDKDGG